MFSIRYPSTIMIYIKIIVHYCYCLITNRIIYLILSYMAILMLTIYIAIIVVATLNN